MAAERTLKSSHAKVLVKKIILGKKFVLLLYTLKVGERCWGITQFNFIRQTLYMKQNNEIKKIWNRKKKYGNENHAAYEKNVSQINITLFKRKKNIQHEIIFNSKLHHLFTTNFFHMINKFVSQYLLYIVENLLYTFLLLFFCVQNCTNIEFPSCKY